MRMSVSRISKIFDLNPISIVKYIQHDIGYTVENFEDDLILSHKDLTQILFVCATQAAACNACKEEYIFTRKICRCGQVLGRCPHCIKYTSFSLKERRKLGRDEYSCDLCSADVAACEHKEGENCYYWAPREGSKWNRYCPSCESDPQRRESERKSADSKAKSISNVVEGASAKVATNIASELSKNLTSSLINNDRAGK